MGKKKKKKIDQMDFNRGLMNFAGDGGGSKEAKELLKRYNVEGYRHGRTDRGGEGYRGFDQIKKDLSDAMMNDYDTRRSMEAAAMAGNKDAKKFAKKGIGPGAKNLAGAWDVMKDLKKEHVGGGGMDGHKNRASLTYALVKHDRDKQTEGYRDEFASKDALAALEDKLKKSPGEEEKYKPEKSEQTLKDEATVKYWDENFATGGVYGDESNKGPGMDSIYKEYGSPLLEPMMQQREKEEKSEAKKFLDAYKKDLFQGSSALMPEI